MLRLLITIGAMLIAGPALAADKVTLMLPKEWGGRGQNHVMYAAVTETIARHGDASCAMCYVMHIGAVEALKLRATEYTVEKYLKNFGESAASPQTRGAGARIAGLKVTESVCPYCAVGCGQLVYTRGGELVDIEGNPRSPINQGTLCPKALMKPGY